MMALAPLRALNALIERNPVAAACTVTGGNATMADLLVQVVVEKRAFPEEIDARRTALFGTFGASYQGLFQYWMRVFSASRNLPKKNAPSFLRSAFLGPRSLLGTTSSSSGCGRGGR